MAVTKKRKRPTRRPRPHPVPRPTISPEKFQNVRTTLTERFPGDPEMQSFIDALQKWMTGGK